MALFLLLSVGLVLLLMLARRLSDLDYHLLASTIRYTVLGVILFFLALNLIMGRIPLVLLMLALLLIFFGDQMKKSWNKIFSPTRSLPKPMSRAEAAKILDVDEDASEIEIQKAYRKLMAENHPDKGGDGNKASQLTEARDVLLKKDA